MADRLAIDEVADYSERILDEVQRAVVGKRGALELVLMALLADGHVLIEDYPGLAKTLMARSFAAVTSAQFARVQFTPDLMPSDVTGSSIFNQRTSRVRVPARPGLHQCPARRRDQPRAAEDAGRAARGDAGAPGHRSRSAHGRLEPPFLVLATQNPIEYEGTYPLPGGAARPLPDPVRALATPSARGRVGDARAPPGAPGRRTRTSIRWSAASSCSRCSGRIERVHVSESVGRYIVASSRPPGKAAACR